MQSIPVQINPNEAIKELAAATGARINPNGVKRRAARVIDALRRGGAK